MGKLKERLLAAISNKPHTIIKWWSGYSQLRQGNGRSGRIAKCDAGASKIHGAVNVRPLLTVENSKLLRQLQDSLEEMALVDEVARIVTSSLDIDEVYGQFSKKVKELVDFDRASIAIFNDDHSGVTTVYGSTKTGSPIKQGQSYPSEGTISARVSESRQPMVLGNLEDHGEFWSVHHFLKEGLHSGIVAPLISGENVYATFSLFSRHTHRFGEREQVIVERLARQIAPAIENARLYQARKQAEERERETAQENTVIAEIGRVISSSLDIEEVYERFTASVSKLLEYDRIVIRLIDEDHSHSIISYFNGMEVPGRENRERATLVGRTQVEEVLRTREPSLIQLGNEAELEKYPGLTPHFKVGLRSFIAVPLFLKDKITGVLITSSLKPVAYTRRHVDLLVQVGNQIAGAIEIARLYEMRKCAEEEQRRAAQENALLAEIGRIISSSLTIDEIYERFADEVRKLIPFDRIVVGLVDLEHDTFSPAYVIGTSIAGRGVGDIVPLAGSATEEVVRTKSPLLMRAEYDEEFLDRFPASESGYRAGLPSMMAVPLIAQDQVIGFLRLQSTERNDYTERDLALLERVGGQIAGAIGNAQSYEQTRQAEEEVRRAAQENALLAEIGRIISSSLAIEEIYEQFATEVKKLVDFDRIAIHVIDCDAGTTLLKYSSGLGPPGSSVGQVRNLSDTRSRDLVETGGTIVVHDLKAESTFPLDRKYLDLGLISQIVVALVSKGQIVGSLTLRSRRTGGYTRRDQAILERLASQIAGVIANAVFYDLSMANAEELAVVDEVARIVTSTLDIDQVYDEFVLEAKKLVDFDRMAVNLVNLESDGFVVKYLFGPDAAEFRLGTVALEGTQSQWVMANGRSLVRDDLAVDPTFSTDQAYLDLGLRSSILLPLSSKGRMIGTLSMRSYQVGAYTSRDQTILERLANQIAPAIENSQLYAERIQLEKEARVLADLGRIVSSSLKIEMIYQRLANRLQELIQFDRLTISKMDDNRVSAIVLVSDGMPYEEIVTGSSVPLQGSLTFEAVEKQLPILLQGNTEQQLDAQYPWLSPGYRAGARTWLAVPLINRDQVIGVLIFISKTPNAYTEQDVAKVERVGNQIAGAIANAQLYEQTLQAEDVLRQLAVAMNSSRDGMSIYNEKGEFVYVNDAFVSIRGYGRPDELIGKHWNVLYAQEELARFDQEILPEFLREGHWRGETTGKRRDESEFPQEISMSVLADGGIVCINRDITERKTAEARISETSRLASIGELAAGVAHEINNPLTSVLGYSEMVLTKKLPKEVSEDIQTIYDEAQRAAKIVDNLLFFVRRGDTQKQYLDLNFILTRSLEIKSYDFKVNNIEVVSQLSPEIRRTMVDEHQLVQVFLNLLTNAEQAIHKESRKGQIRICTAILGDEITITMEDDGPGMPSEVLHRIFDPFFTTKGVGQGTGLGLSISYGIIKQHGGNIWAESVEGEGTTFHITLPVLLPEEITIPQLSTSVSNGKATKHLLVVDDEPHIRDLLRKYLELERYTVDLAVDGNEAWRKIQQMDYDCILLDLKMPGLNGQELYQLTLDLKPSLARKVVFITGDTVSPEARDFVAQCDNPLVTKPFRREQLMKTVHDMWDSQTVSQPG